MKLILNWICIFGVLVNVQAQQVNKLLGAHSNAGIPFFSALNVPGFSYNTVSVLSNSINPSAGETTFDEFGYRYFVKSNSGILVIDALNGRMLDTVKNAASFYNIEYDRFSNRLVGMSLSGNSIKFLSYDLNTRSFTTKNTALPFDSIIKGESTFDPVNRRYFTMTELGMVVIDSTGQLRDVLCASLNLNGIEYDILSNRIYYLEWRNGNFDFTSLEATSCTVGYICSLAPDTLVFKGESTFDRTLGHYYSRTNLGLVQINSRTGLTQRHPISNNFGQMEFAEITTVGIRKNSPGQKISISPNPSDAKFNFSNLTPGSTLDVFNISGQIISHFVMTGSSCLLDLEKEARGIYFYRISDNGQEMERGKLVLH